MAKKRGKSKTKSGARPERKPDEGPSIETATPERLAQFGMEPASFKTETGRITKRLSVLDALYQRDEISPEAYLAAAGFLTDWEVGINSRTTSSLSDKVDGGGGADHYNARRMDAARRYQAAQNHMGPAYHHVVMAVLVDDISLTAYAVRHLGSNPKSRKASDRCKSLLIKALNSLAKFYAPVITKPRPRRHAAMTGDARPSITPLQQDEAA